MASWREFAAHPQATIAVAAHGVRVLFVVALHDFDEGRVRVVRVGEKPFGNRHGHDAVVGERTGRTEEGEVRCVDVIELVDAAYGVANQCS